MEKYLNQQLKAYNRQSQNQYKQCWGTSLDFISDNQTQLMGQTISPFQIFNTQANPNKPAARTQTTVTTPNDFFYADDRVNINRTLQERITVY